MNLETQLGYDNEAERLAAVQQLWLETASVLNTTAAGTEKRQIAQMAYAVSVRARLEWETDQGVQLDHAESAQRMNELFSEGLQRSTAPADGEVVDIPRDYTAWNKYFHTEIYPSLHYKGDPPANHYELALQLKNKHAKFIKRPKG